MSEIKALEKLRKLSKEVVDMRWGVEFDRVVDALEAEIAERFMELPVDADGAPVRVGDRLIREVNDGIIYTVAKLKFDGRYWWYESGNDCFACDCARHKPRTLEDVLQELEGLRGYGNSTYEDVVTRAAELADEIRAMLGEVDE